MLKGSSVRELANFALELLRRLRVRLRSWGGAAANAVSIQQIYRDVNIISSCHNPFLPSPQPVTVFSEAKVYRGGRDIVPWDIVLYSV